MISVVFSTYQRAHLMERSLHCYAHQELSVPFELVVLDDGSTDHTQALCDEWAKHIDIKYLKFYKSEGLWRDCSMTINTGLRAAQGDLIIPTHPEVMPGKRSLQALWDAKQDRSYLACKIYYLTPKNQIEIDTVPWRTEGAGAVRQLPDFYESPSTEVSGDDAYSHRAMDQHKDWNSWVFGGFTRETWKWFGGLRSQIVWGAVDVDFFNRRNKLSIPTRTPLDLDTFCVHQNHDIPGNVPTPRDMEAAMSGLPEYATPDAARLNFI